VIFGAVVVGVCGGVGYLVGLATNDKPIEVQVQPGLIKAAEVEPTAKVAFGSDRRRMNALIRAERDPLGALASLEREIGIGEAEAYEDIYFAMFTAWALRDPDGAIAAVDHIKSGPKRSAMLAVMDAVHSIDAERGGDLLVEWRFGSAGMPSWTRKYPEQACRLLERLGDTMVASDIRSNAPRWWAEQDPQAALDWALTMQGKRSESVVHNVFDGWVLRDLPRAIAAYESGQFEDPKLQKHLAQLIARASAKDGPLEAIEWLAEQDHWRGDSNGVGNIVRAWATTDPRGAAAFVAESGQSMQTSSGLMQAIGESFIKVDAPAALDWVDALPDATRAPAEAAMFTQLIKEDAALAVVEFNRRLDRLSAPTVERFSADYFKQDAEAATGWLATVPRGIAYNYALQGVFVASREDGYEALLELAEDLKAGG
jgi:hypothetical protein